MARTKADLIERLRRLTPGDLQQLSNESRARILAFLSVVSHEHTDSLCSKSVASFEAGPLYWLTKLTATENPHYEYQGLPYRASFPQKAYFVPVFEAFLRCQRLFIPKSREMMTSWSVVAYATWRAQWFKWDCILQTASLAKVTELVDYAAQLWRNQNDWLKHGHPLATKEPTVQELTFADGGRVRAIPSGENQIRLYHPTLYVQDESAFLPEAEQCFNAAMPVAKQIIGISTAAPGFFGDQCSL
jgi:hypothetical protein